MDGRGRAFDNIFVERLWRTVKHKDVYLKGYATMGDLMVGLTGYFEFYNFERPHQSLEYRTPEAAYRTGHGGRAVIVDKPAKEESKEKTSTDVKTEQHRLAVNEVGIA
jgi:putative transposase